MNANRNIEIKEQNPTAVFTDRFKIVHTLPIRFGKPFLPVGEVRLPKKGEYYFTHDRIFQATNDFESGMYPIYTKL